MKKIVWLVCLITSVSFAQEPISTKSQLKEVTVFLQGAQLTRYSEIDLPTGNSTVKITGLSPYLDRNSLLVKGIGDFTVMSVNHQLNYLNEKSLDALLKGLQDSIQYYSMLLDEVNNDINVLAEKENFLRTNIAIRGDGHMDPEKFKAIHFFYGDQMTYLKNERSRKARKQYQIQITLSQFQQQLAQEQKRKHDAESEVFVEVYAEKAIKAKFQLSYLVAHAAWFPTYDIRVQSVSEPLSLIYKANISQSTGEDWNNVQLTISNANPFIQVDLPELMPWYLSFGSPMPYYRKGKAEENSAISFIGQRNATVLGRVQDANGFPLAGATVRIVNSSIGTVSDADGNFTLVLPPGVQNVQVSYVGYNSWAGTAIEGQFMNVRLSEAVHAVQEVAVVRKDMKKNAPAAWSSNANQAYYDGAAAVFKAASAPVVHKMENQAHLRITLDKPYTILSNGKQKMVEIQQESLPAYYEYRAVPKIEQSAFLMARIDDWAKLNLLEGEANLYFENSYVGKTLLDVRYLSDTLDISLGRDKGISINREKIRSFSTREFIGSDRIEKRTFEIKIVNGKKHPINLVVLDQIPVSQQKDILVTLKNRGDAVFNEQKGELTWQLKPASGESKTLSFEYHVKFPKGREVILE